MNGVLKRFADLAGVHIAPGAKEKRFTHGSQMIRLMQFSPPYQEILLCTKAHVGFVVSGEFAIEFTNSRVQFREGDALSIPAGPASAHRAIFSQEATPILVEPA